ncbi:hypothetical protein H261_23297, partial [Paramagnetospirillum caucaseum]
DPPEVLQLVEEALDQVSLAVQHWINGSLGLAVALCRDLGAATPSIDQFNQITGVITSISDEGFGRR